MTPFINQPGLHLQWRLLTTVLAAGQLKESFGIEAEEVATLAIASVAGVPSGMGTPSTELRLLAIGWGTTDAGASWILGALALTIAEETFGIDLGTTA